jgi:large subunit ribosomal protein L3
MQVWPRVRAGRIYKKVKRFPQSKEAKLLSFSGYKVGMTHIMVTDGRKYSMTKGEDITFPVTVIECPPIRIAGVRLYKKKGHAMQPSTDILAKADKELNRKIDAPKKESKKLDTVKVEDFDEMRVLIETQPKMTGIGKKKPELFEASVGGNKEEKLKFAKENLGKEVSIKDVYKEGQLVDIHAVTIGKGFQGPVKRFGVKVRSHKAEKTKRGPGSLGGWSAQGHVMYRVAHAGQMGYHNRVDYNKQILMISDDPSKINVNGGHVGYGNVKNTYVLIKGSVAGPEKRIIRMEAARRPNPKTDLTLPTIQYISLASKQGN